jgi:hypothetical protein
MLLRLWCKGRRLAASGLLAALCWAAVAAACRGADPQAVNARIQAHLAAGEFAPARDLARQAPPARRDALLAQVAAAQAQAGARDAALGSLAEIGDDRARAAAIASLADQPLGGRGGGNQADFESLIDLITSTVQPPSWDKAGGNASIKEFPTGVLVDPQGVLRPMLKEEAGRRLAALRAAAAPGQGSAADVRRASRLRMVSLPRLEKQVQLCLAAGREPSEEMLLVAGLQRIQYLFVYPDTGDLVLAGPAGDWKFGPEGAIVGADSGLPVVRLDDLVVVFRAMMSGPNARFGCMINARQEALARVMAFVEQSNKRSIRPEQRRAWLEHLRSLLGRQDIVVHGVASGSRAARVMVEADYRMKLIGMGIEKGVPGVESYLDSVKVAPGQAPPPMRMLRWWFTLNYDAVTAAQDRQAFALRGQGVKVESENERLTAEGKRIHTGQSEELNRKFAQSFTEHFEALAQKYPIYAELRNLCDLAMFAALIRQEGLADRVGWHLTCFGSPAAYRIELGETPKEVDTVINHRVIHGRHILTGISGGVSVEPASLVRSQAIQTERSPALGSRRSAAAPRRLSGEAWWWD